MADHLLAVAARAPVADVDSAGLAPGGGLPDELVELEVVHHPGEPLAPRLGVRDEDVGSAATGVVRGFHAPYGGVELWRAVAAVDADGVEAELLEVADRRAPAAGCCTSSPVPSRSSDSAQRRPRPAAPHA